MEDSYCQNQTHVSHTPTTPWKPYTFFHLSLKLAWKTIFSESYEVGWMTKFYIIARVAWNKCTRENYIVPELNHIF